MEEPNGEESLNEFESVEKDGTGACGIMGRDGYVMNETDIPASEHTVDPQGQVMS